MSLILHNMKQTLSATTSMVHANVGFLAENFASALQLQEPSHMLGFLQQDHTSTNEKYKNINKNMSYFLVIDDNKLFFGSIAVTNALLIMSFIDLLTSVEEDLHVTMIHSSSRNTKVIWTRDMEQKLLDFLHKQV